MTYNDLLKYFGSSRKAADALNLTRQGVHRWKTRRIPLDKQVAFEVASNGALKADIPKSVRAA